MADSRAVSVEPCNRGRHRRWRWREVLDAIFYGLRADFPWRLLPDRFPPFRTVYRWFGELRDSGSFEGLNHYLFEMDRMRVGREPMPSVPVIDSQREDHRSRRSARFRRR
jgi:transposase